MSGVRIRLALLAAIAPEDILAAAFGDPSLRRAEGSLYPKGTALYDAETPAYNSHDPAKAAAMLKVGGYDGGRCASSPPNTTTCTRSRWSPTPVWKTSASRLTCS